MTCDVDNRSICSDERAILSKVETNVKINKMALPWLTVLACASSPVSATTALLGQNLQSLTTFSNTYTTTGANSWIYGSALTGDVGTSGAGAHITRDFTALGASTIGGAGSAVTGNMIAGGVLTTGDGATVGGFAIAGGAASIGANSVITGYVAADGAVSTGDSSRVNGNIDAGGAASIGANASVGGTVSAVGAISLSASSTVTATQSRTTSPVDTPALTASISDSVTSDRVELLAAQAALSKMGTTTFLDPTIVTNRTLLSGVYSAASLSTTAGTTLTLDGQGMANQFWVFNITDILATGASTQIVLINGADSKNIIWNAGGYASLGANSIFVGTLIARQYISVGAAAEVAGSGQSCGGIFSALSYISTGDSAKIGNGGCSGIASNFDVDDNGAALFRDVADPLPEPAIWVLWLTGFGLVGWTKRRTRFLSVVA